LGGGAIQLQSSEVGTSETLQELLVDQLRDLLHAEKQLLKALPKMACSATIMMAAYRQLNWPNRAVVE
jgi:Mn-containing catalase